MVPVFQSSRTAFQLLRAAFIFVPGLAGYDKLSTAWGDGLRLASSTVAAFGAFRVDYALYAVGTLELCMCVLVLVKPRLGGYVLAGWFAACAVSFALMGQNWHVAIRDAGLSLAALSLASLSSAHAVAFDRSVLSRGARAVRARVRSARSDTLVSAPDE